MTWQLGLVLVCFSLVALWPVTALVNAIRTRRTTWADRLRALEAGRRAIAADARDEAEHRERIKVQARWIQLNTWHGPGPHEGAP